MLLWFLLRVFKTSFRLNRIYDLVNEYFSHWQRNCFLFFTLLTTVVSVAIFTCGIYVSEVCASFGDRDDSISSSTALWVDETTLAH